MNVFIFVYHKCWYRNNKIKLWLYWLWLWIYNHWFGDLIPYNILKSMLKIYFFSLIFYIFFENHCNNCCEIVTVTILIFFNDGWCVKEQNRMFLMEFISISFIQWIIILYEIFLQYRYNIDVYRCISIYFKIFWYRKKLLKSIEITVNITIHKWWQSSFQWYSIFERIETI